MVLRLCCQDVQTVCDEMIGRMCIQGGRGGRDIYKQASLESGGARLRQSCELAQRGGGKTNTRPSASSRDILLPPPTAPHTTLNIMARLCHRCRKMRCENGLRTNGCDYCLCSPRAARRRRGNRAARSRASAQFFFFSSSLIAANNSCVGSHNLNV